MRNVLSRWAISILMPFVFGVSVLSTSNAPALGLEIIHKKQVIELFTSQGCSSCPPADELLKKISKNDEILTLAWHVDYWDYLGWKDVFGSKAFTKRQYDYAEILVGKRVYTPQAIINGHSHVVGSQYSQISKQLQKDDKLLKNMRVEKDGGQMHIKLDGSASKSLVLYAVWYDNSAKTIIKHGENAGKNIVYSHIVKHHKRLFVGKVGGIDTMVSIKLLKDQGADNCALLVQEMQDGKYPGQIHAAAVINLNE